MIERAKDFRLATFIVAMICIAALYFLKEFLQPRIKKLKLPAGLNKMPLPFDLLVVRSVATFLISGNSVPFDSLPDFAIRYSNMFTLHYIVYYFGVLSSYIRVNQYANCPYLISIREVVRSNNI